MTSFDFVKESLFSDTIEKQMELCFTENTNQSANLNPYLSAIDYIVE